jgi:uncharacterized protein (TIGR02246 family)
MTVFRLSLVVVAVLVLDSCARPAETDGASRREVNELVQAYQKASNDGDAHELAALYTDQALLLPPDGGVVAGRDSILAFWLDGLERGLTLDTVRVVTHDREGYVVGVYHLAATDELAADSGKYVLCVERGETGWRLAVDTWNTTTADDASDEEDADPRTRTIRAAASRLHYRFMTIGHGPMRRRVVEAHPTTIQRVKSRRTRRSSD